MHRHSYMPVRAPGGDRGQDWRDAALCRDEDPELFHPMPEGDPTPALAVCGRCPVTAACLDWAMRAGDDHAVLGGTTPAQRRQIRRGWPVTPPRRARLPRACPRCGTDMTHARLDRKYCTRRCYAEAQRSDFASHQALRRRTRAQLTHRTETTC